MAIAAPTVTTHLGGLGRILGRRIVSGSSQPDHGGAVGAYDFSRLPDEQLKIVYHDKRFGDLRADRRHGVERAHRLLKDHADTVATDAAQVALREPDGSAGVAIAGREVVFVEKRVAGPS
jgi:hypothetical protein